MALDTNTTVRELALDLPHATRIFEQLGIDYCCGGGKSLNEACNAAGLSVGHVINSLEEAACYDTAPGDAPDFKTAPLALLIAHIVTRHHVFTKQELSRFGELMAKVCGAHGANHPELFDLRAAFERLRGDLQPHMMKEEMVLFPHIIRMEEALSKGLPAPLPPFGTVRNPVRMMSLEHDVAGDLLREMRRAAADYTVPPDACISYRTLYQALEAFEHDLHQHIHLENNILFPRAVEMEDSLLAMATC